MVFHAIVSRKLGWEGYPLYHSGWMSATFMASFMDRSFSK